MFILKSHIYVHMVVSLPDIPQQQVMQPVDALLPEGPCY